jgi:carbon storage regulator
MLVLTRKLGEQIIIDGNIRIKVLALKRNAIRLGIEAPDEIHVMRLELLAKKSANASMSATESSPDRQPNNDPSAPFCS